MDQPPLLVKYSRPNKQRLIYNTTKFPNGWMPTIAFRTKIFKDTSVLYTWMDQINSLKNHQCVTSFILQYIVTI